jgi:hypothetical protein
VAPDVEEDEALAGVPPPEDVLDAFEKPVDDIALL